MGNELFPRARSAEILGELSAWTSVADIMVAARILEGRTVPGDKPESMLLMPLEYAEPAFEQIFAILLGYLVDGFAVPPQKVAVCRALDSQITEATATALQSLHFRPTVQVGRVPKVPDKRVFVIQDQPATIELVRAPLNCLMGLYLDKYEYTKRLRDVVAEAEDMTGAAPRFFIGPTATLACPASLKRRVSMHLAWRLEHDLHRRAKPTSTPLTGP